MAESDIKLRADEVLLNAEIKGTWEAGREKHISEKLKIFATRYAQTGPVESRCAKCRVTRQIRSYQATCNL